MKKAQLAMNRVLFGHIMFRCMTHSTDEFEQDADGNWVRPNDVYNWRTSEIATISEARLQMLPNTRFGWTCVLVALCLESNGKQKIKMQVERIRGGWTSNELDDKINILTWAWANKFPNLVNWGYLAFPVYPKLTEEREDQFLNHLKKFVDLEKYWRKDDFRYRP